MEITFLGTSAAEHYPALWCRCDNCERARNSGGRNIRTTSSIHFNKTCLIDFTSEEFIQAKKFGIDIINSEFLLVTHSHEDHFSPHLLRWRIQNASNIPVLYTWGNQCVYNSLMKGLRGFSLEDCAIKYEILKPYREYTYKNIHFVPLIASHEDINNSPGLIYWVGVDNHSFLYAVDSGPCNDRTRDYIRGLHVDAVIMEETFGFKNGNKNHMNWDSAMREVQFFMESGIFKNSPKVYWTHMSPHSNPLQYEMEKMLQGSFVVPAYDGMTITI